jgi:RNA polymerase sigma factor for flagellar operon FliA
VKQEEQSGNAKEKQMASVDDLIRSYKKHNDRRAREALIQQCAHLIKYVLGRQSMTMPSILDSDDLVSAGSIGLIDAIERFDLSRNVKFTTYAFYRIRGSILDELRSVDHMSRSSKEKLCNYRETVQQLENELGRGATDEEIFTRLSLTVDQYYDFIYRINCARLLSLDAIGVDDEGVQYYPMLNVVRDDIEPPELLEKREIRAQLKQALDDLNEHERLVLQLYYYEDLTLKEIAAVMGLSESRICQLHGRAIIRLRSRLGSRGSPSGGTGGRNTDDTSSERGSESNDGNSMGLRGRTMYG